MVTCIHNVLSQQRYLEHYGEVTIRNLKSGACTCRITFVKVKQPPAAPVGLGPAWPSLWAGPDRSVFCLKSRYWGSDANKNEIQGTVLDQSGNVIHSFGGLWHEGIFCDTLPTPKCIWKPSESFTSTNALFLCPIAAGCVTILSPHRSTAKGLPPLLRLLHLRHGAERTHARPDASAAPYRHPPAP